MRMTDGLVKGGGQSRSRMKGRLLFLAEVVLLMGFVVSMIGIMILYNQNISLQLLLEEEREHVKEVEGLNGDLKLEASKLEAHNIEREGRFAEMQVTISTLRDDIVAARSALEEKQRDFMALRERYAQVEDEASKVRALEQVMRAKEAEIEDLKNSLQVHLAMTKKPSEDAAAATDSFTNSTPSSPTSDHGISDETENRTPFPGEQTKEGAATESETVTRNEGLNAEIKMVKRKLENISDKGNRKRGASKRRAGGRRKRSVRRRARESSD